ncbi:diguanylate cyclase [Endozoicomonas sp.]|uniref:diguanylate cyclase n=1 Tax=Endozoicomonas sp. TaxID=1892382 RepID=UPI002887E514|nr:diguanylate cyclase [Endozoicomonas sp.]
MESWFYLLCLISILTLSDPLAAAPLYISGDDPLPVTHLASVEPPPHIFKSSQVQDDTPSNWYRLDIELSEYSPHDWLMVFRQAPHKKLDIFVPVNGGYHLKKMGVDGSRSGIAPNALKLDIKPGETKTWYLRHASVPPNQLNPTLWPSLTYFEKLSEQQNTISSIQTLLIVALIFIFTLTLRNRTPALYLLISHMLAANVMILMWEGEIFRVISWLGDPGHWLILMTTLVLTTGITSYRTLALLPIYCPRIDRLILSLNALGVALVLYAISSPSPPPSTTMELAASALLASFALVVIATAYCLYNGIRPAKTAFPSALIMLLFLSYSWFTEAWPRSLPTYPELLLLSLHAALLPLFYWHSHQQNLQHAMSINAIAPDSRKRRIFETALRQHLQNPDSPLADTDITQRVLSTFEEVLPGMPAMILHHQRDEWHMILGDAEDHSKTADSLRKQLPTIEDDLLNVISSGTETKINFKDRYGTIYWVLPLNIEAEDKILMVLSPLRHHRNATTWQTACDISSHACTLLQANRQSLFWQQQASLDPLTGLLNRRAFYLEAEKIIQASVNNDSIQPCCALFMDIDNFKQLNDQQGHSAGDLVLKNTALLCRMALRHKDLLGRYGGEEFVALLPNTEPWQAFRVAERIRNAIANEAANNSKQANHKPMTVSIGISALSSGANTLDKILEEADSAMYRAKQKGKNRTSISTRLMDVRIPLS